MLDLNDRSQLALSDRQGWLGRAAQVASRWSQAQAQGDHCAESIPDAPQEGIVWLALPTPLRGIGRALQALSVHLQPLVLAVQPDLADLPVTAIWLDPYEILPPSQTRPGPLLAPDDLPEINAHPATHYLFWLSFLDHWLGRDLSTNAVQIPADRLQLLATCAPSVATDENPAKQIAHTLHERLPIFWAAEALSGIAYDWWQRYTLYAEAKAEWTDAAAIRHITAMTRFPRYWPQAGLFVRLAQEQDNDTGWYSDLAQLFQRRRLGSLSFAAELPSLAAAMLYLLELGEWTALYAAALLGVDPADRVALDYLDSLSNGSGSV